MDVLRGKWWLCAGLSLCLMAGCEGWSGSISLGKSDSTEEAEEAELGLDEVGAEALDKAAGEKATGEEEADIQTAGHSAPSSFDTAEPLNEAGKGERLALNLKTGERFPLIKEVVQTVYQSGQGGDRRSQSKLNIKIVLTMLEHPVQGPHAGEYLFEVKYHGVKYEQNLLGKTLAYNSEDATGAVPAELQTYQNLIGNGFSFWLKENNQIGELVGFEEFLKRCLGGAEGLDQAEAKNLIASTTGTEGFANFVDDSIGLLPPTAIRMGDTWSIDRQVLQPIAMKISSRYSLTSLDESSAEISILGQVSPIASVSTDSQNRPLNVVVEGGQVFGSCTIDRRSGLPVHSQVNQEISMRVKLADQPEFRQRKQSITTIRAFPQQGNAVTGGPTGNPAGGVIQTSGDNLPGGVQQTGGLSSALEEAQKLRQADLKPEDAPAK